MATFIYILYIVVASMSILSSILKYRTIFHPQTLIVIIIVVLFMSDFIISGYSERVLGDYSFKEIQWHQMTILFVCCSIIYLTFLLANADSTRTMQRTIMTDLSWAKNGLIPWIAFSIIALDMLKRMYFAEWSPLDAVLLSIAPRGSAPWHIKGGDLGNLGDGNFIFGITTILMPFSCLTMYCRYLSHKGINKIVALVFTVVSLLVMIFDGTRTPVVYVVALSGIIYYYNSESTRKKIMAIVVAMLMIAVLTSFMYLFRSEGYTDIDEKRDDVTLVYHQDDNYAQAIHSLITASDTNERWDSLEFLSAIIVNPIPRYFWPNKPALLADYWGNYKNEWTTITALGELGAMFGPIIGPICTVIVGIILYLLLNYIFMRFNSALDFMVYMMFSLYAYMVLRSLLNISQFVYMPLFLLILSKLNMVTHEAANK